MTTTMLHAQACCKQSFGESTTQSERGRRHVFFLTCCTESLTLEQLSPLNGHCAVDPAC